MKNKSLVIYSTLVLTILLSSCWNKETQVKIEETKTGSENTQALDEINNEMQKVEENNEMSQTGENITQSGTTTAKVVKLDKVYTSPGWQDEVEFSISLNGNVIENVETKLIKWNNETKRQTENFNKNINDEIKGKTIEEAKNINIVWGSSLTTEAFKSALKDLK